MSGAFRVKARSWRRFSWTPPNYIRSNEDRREVRIPKVDDKTAAWRYAACLSEEVLDLLESNWQFGMGIGFTETTIPKPIFVSM